MSRLDDLEKQLQEAESTIRDLKEKIRLSDIDALRKSFQESGYHEDGEAWDYVRALEKCRPWVISLRGGESLWKYEGSDGTWHAAMFPSKAEAVAYAGSVGAGSDFEVVQWEGNQ